MSGNCVLQLLRTAYFSAYDILKDKLRFESGVTLEYVPCPALDDMVSFQEVDSEDSTVPSIPKYIVAPPSEGVPQRPNHN